jgi:hypothetical protein
MRTSRRIATLGLTVLACGALVGGTAGAQAASTYEASATADALTITLLGQTITTSSATAALSSAPKATASASDVLLGPVVSSGPHQVELSAPGSAEDPKAGTACTGNELTAVPGIRRLDLTCGSATATITGTGGSARGLGAELVVEPSVSGILSTLGLQQPAQGAVGQVNEQVIAPLVKALTGTPIEQLVSSGTQTVQDVLNKVLSLQTTARIMVAPALAETTADASTVAASAHAQGVRIELLPLDGAGATNNLLPGDLKVGEPLVTITVGDAKACKSIDRATGKVTECHDAALVTIALGSNELAKALGLPSEPITVKADQSFCVPGLEGTPLETCVTVAKAGRDAKGNPFADGTSIQLFKGLQGGIDIALGRASVTNAPTEAAVAAPASAEPTVAGDLPRTGGTGTLPLVGAGLLGLAVLARRATRRTV